MKMGEEAGIGRVEFVWIQIKKVNQTRHWGVQCTRYFWS